MMQSISSYVWSLFLPTLHQFPAADFLVMIMCQVDGRLQPQVVETRLVGQKSVADFLQGVLACILGIEGRSGTDDTLTLCAEASAVAAVSATFDGFFKTMSGRNWKSWGKMVLYCIVQGFGAETKLFVDTLI